MGEGRFIAVDWGTSNRRTYLLDDGGGLINSERDDCGVLAMRGRCFAEEAARLRARFGDLPMFCAGMVGSARGWASVPYLECPAGLAELAAGLHWIEPGRSAIVPGLSSISGHKGDTMRGEEVQLLGAVHAGLVPGDALLCQPGTHCKWARMADGKVAAFRTTMTGELFALLREHSLLSDVIAGEASIGEAFDQGLADARQQSLLSDLFRVRASGLLGLRSKEDAVSYVSGLLIGSDVREQDPKADDEIYILADPTFGGFYCHALRARGVASHVIDSHAAFVAGIARIRELAHAA
jgi:2-dehydro-3-deoxygalactonokinase